MQTLSTDASPDPVERRRWTSTALAAMRCSQTLETRTRSALHKLIPSSQEAGLIAGLIQSLLGFAPHIGQGLLTPRSVHGGIAKWWSVRFKRRRIGRHERQWLRRRFWRHQRLCPHWYFWRWWQRIFRWCETSHQRHFRRCQWLRLLWRWERSP